MSTRRSPDPGVAGELGSSALQAAVLINLVIPIVQHMMWMILVEVPATTSLSQPPNAWLYIAIIGIFPAIIFVGGVLTAKSKVGIVGAGAYVVMALASSQLFQNPALSVFMVIGVVVVLFVYLAIKAIGSSRQKGRGPRGGFRR